MDSSIFVLGSNSFSGASFCAHCLAQGVRVIGASRSDQPNDVFLPYRWDNRLLKYFKFLKLDLNHDLDAIVSALKAERIGIVVNFASQSMVAQSWDAPGDWFHTNVTSTVRLHDALRKLPFLERYVHISTPEVYGSTGGYIAENNNFYPSTPYAVSRAAADMSLLSFYNAYDFPVVFTRAANVYGPGQQLYRIIPRAVMYGLTGESLQLHGGGSSERSFIHIDDVSAATFSIANHAPAGESYHISTRRLISIRDLVALISDQMGIRFDDLVDNADERRGKDQTYALDDTKLRETFGWEDRVSLEEGIDQTIRWATQYIDILKTMSQSYVHKP